MLPTPRAIESTVDGYRRFGDLVATLVEEDLARPTRLRGWTVRDLLAHVAWAQAMEADAMRRAVSGDVSLAGADRVPSDSDLGALVDAVQGAHHALTSALADVPELDPATQVALPAGVLPLPGALTLCVVEAGLHASDLAQALGRPDALSEDEVAACAALIRPLLALAAGAGVAPAPGTSYALVGESITEQWVAHGSAWAPSRGTAATTISGTDEAIVLFIYGRIEHTDDRLEVAGDLEAAGRFKDFFPGP